MGGSIPPGRTQDNRTTEQRWRPSLNGRAPDSLSGRWAVRFPRGARRTTEQLNNAGAPRSTAGPRTLYPGDGRFDSPGAHAGHLNRLAPLAQWQGPGLFIRVMG